MLLAIIVFILISNAVSKYNRAYLQFNNDPHNTFFEEFKELKAVKRLKFRPHFLSILPLQQSINYLFMEWWYKKFFPIKMDLELIKCPDGGTLGLFWR